MFTRSNLLHRAGLSGSSLWGRDRLPQGRLRGLCLLRVQLAEGRGAGTHQLRLPGDSEWEVHPAGPPRDTGGPGVQQPGGGVG